MILRHQFPILNLIYFKKVYEAPDLFNVTFNGVTMSSTVVKYLSMLGEWIENVNNIDYSLHSTLVYPLSVGTSISI